MKDLEPYICVLPDCSKPQQLFLFFGDWITHMQTEHRPLTWKCFAETHGVEVFDNSDSYIEHMKNVHRGTFVISQLPELAQINAHGDSWIFDICPLCNDDNAELNRDQGALQIHVSEHLQLLALQSLAWLDESKSGASRYGSSIDTDDLSSESEIITHDVDRKRETDVLSEPIAIDNDPQWTKWSSEHNQSLSRSQQWDLHDFKPAANDTGKDPAQAEGSSGNITSSSRDQEGDRCQGTWSIYREYGHDKTLATFRDRYLASMASDLRQEGSDMVSASSDLTISREHLSMANLAATYRDQGRYDEAEKLQVQVMEIRKRVLGEKHPDTLTSIANLASIHRDQERWKAEELFVQVMEIRKRVLGQEHPDTLTSMANLASIYVQERWKAEELLVQVIETRKRVLGQEHPDTLTSMANLASIYRDQERWKEAEYLFVQVMEIRERVLRVEHSDILTSIVNLASIYQKQGRWEEAEKLCMQVMETRKKVLGEEHSDTLTSIINLAAMYRDQGRYDEAEKLQMQVMEIRKRVLGQEHPDTLTSIANVTSIYRDQGRWKEAEKLCVQVMETRKKVLGEEHSDTLTSMVNVTSIYRDQGRWEEAEKLCVQVMKTRKKVLDEEHSDTLTSIINLAAMYRDQGRYDEAEKLQTQVMEIRKRVLGEEHPDTLTSMTNLASIYQNPKPWKTFEELEVLPVSLKAASQRPPH